jgi:hypothetical protein
MFIPALTYFSLTKEYVHTYIFYPIVTLVELAIHCSSTININIAVLILHIVTVSDYTYQPPKDLRLNWGKSSEIHEMERVLPQ